MGAALYTPVQRTPTAPPPVVRAPTAPPAAPPVPAASGTGPITGPITSQVPFTDTWEWDRSQWVQVATTGTKPTLRRQHAMAYDSNRGRVVMFGGANGQARNSQTWEYGP